jgi:hypothetical protein
MLPGGEECRLRAQIVFLAPFTTAELCAKDYVLHTRRRYCGGPLASLTETLWLTPERSR